MIGAQKHIESTIVSKFSGGRGNSSNVVNAIQAAKKKGMKVIGLTGKDGGKMAGISDIEVRVPHSGYSDRIQEVHIKVIHSLIQYVEQNPL